MSRFVEEPEAGQVWFRSDDPEQPPPRTAQALLSMLRVTRASEAEQRRAVARWLEQNEPEPILVRQLTERGYC